MRFFDPDNVATATGGRWLTPPTGVAPLRGVGIDTRGDIDGRVFVAIRGANHDGHDFLGPATAGGARVLVVDRQPAAERLDPAVAVLLVDDTRRALGELATAWRQTLTTTTVVAVTGSCGKTTVKSLLENVLSRRLVGTAAPRSFNNDIGVPLAILAADRLDQYLVLEIGTLNEYLKRVLVSE